MQLNDCAYCNYISFVRRYTLNRILSAWHFYGSQSINRLCVAYVPSEHLGLDHVIEKEHTEQGKLPVDGLDPLFTESLIGTVESDIAAPPLVMLRPPDMGNC